MKTLEKIRTSCTRQLVHIVVIKAIVSISIRFQSFVLSVRRYQIYLFFALFCLESSEESLP